MDEGEDLYDDIFDQNQDNHYAEADIDDLYGNIHNPEVAETALDKVKGLTAEKEKFSNQNAQLKNQISILNTINLELKTKNTHLEKNIKDLIETSRVEINRKNEQVRNLRAELDNVLFKRAARNINKRELEDLLKKYRPKEEPYSKLPSKPKPLVKKVEIAALASPDLNTGNRQFVRKRKRISLENSTVAKKAKTEDNKENVVTSTKTVIPAVVNKVLDDNSNPSINSEDKIDVKPQTETKPGVGLKPTAVPNPPVKPGQPILKPKLDILDVSLISNYVKDKPRKSKKLVLETRTESDPEPSKPDQVPSSVEHKVDTEVIEEKQVTKPVEPVNKVSLDKTDTTAKPSDSEKTSSTEKPAVQARLTPEVKSKTKPSRKYVPFDKLGSKSKLSKPVEPAPKSTPELAIKKPVVERKSSEAPENVKVSKDIDLPIKLFDITSAANENLWKVKDPKPKGAKSESTEAPKTPAIQAQKSAKNPKEKPADSSLDFKSRRVSKGEVKEVVKVPVETKASNANPISSTVKQKSKCSTEPKKSSLGLDSENNSPAVPQSDHEASTSSQLKSPISKPNSVKTPQEWALGHQLFDIFEEKPKVKSRSKSRGKVDKEPAKKVVNKVTVEKAKKIIVDSPSISNVVEKVKKASVETPDKKPKVDVDDETPDKKDLKAADQKPSENIPASSPQSYGSTRWNCDIHKLGFRTRDDLRMHRSNASCFKKRNPSADSPKKRNPSSDTLKKRNPSGEIERKRIPSGEKRKTRVPSGDQKDFGCEVSKNQKEKKGSKVSEGRKQQKHSEVDKSEESGIITTSVEIGSIDCEETGLVKQSSVTSEELDDAVRSITPTDDVLELGIVPSDAFEDELDFEPEEPVEEESAKNVYFKNLNTNFSIPKVDKSAVEAVEEETIKSTPAKAKAKERELEKKKEKQRPGRERSRSRNRAGKTSTRPIRRSRSRRRKSRSLSRRRRSKSRNRSRSRNRRKSGHKSPRKRSPSRDRGRTNRRRSSRTRKRSESRTRGRQPRSLSRNRSGERRRPSSRTRLEKLSRRSQSLSPERLKSPEIDLENIEIEDEMSLDSLEKIKQKLMGKMNLNEDLKPLKDTADDFEDGEITDTEDEEVQDILKKKGGVDLRQKLLRKSRPSSKTGSDKENVVKRKLKSSTGGRSQESIGIKACLKEYSADELENKLIPFKKRQFHELQFEELKIRKQIERARSKSSTPVRSVSESSASDCPQNNSQGSSTNYLPDNPMVDLKMSPMVDTMKSPVVRDRRVSRSNSRSEDMKSPATRSRNVSLCEQKETIVYNVDPVVSPSESDRKVSPIKLSLRGVVIERPSSSSSEANVESVEVILEKVENSSQEERMKLQQDDNAVFPSMKSHTTPTKPSKFSTDVSKDLFLTDDSDFEESPVKVFKQPSYISPFRRPEGPLDLSSPKRPPLTPKTPLQPQTNDVSSPQGISDMLRSPLVNHSILSPVTSTKLTSKLNFSQAVTSTPSAPTTTSVTSNLKVPPTPALLQPTQPSNLSSSNPVVKAQVKTKKKRIRLGRSATSDT